VLCTMAGTSKLINKIFIENEGFGEQITTYSIVNNIVFPFFNNIKYCL
jgi:hypothetical protein